VNHSRWITYFASAALLLSATTNTVFAENWPNWRGPNGDGISGEKGLPTTWSEKKNIAWKLELPGIGSSSPVVWGDRMFLTSSEGKDLVLLCVGTNGKLLWKEKIAAAQRGASRKDEGNEASPSAATDGKHVFVYVGTGDVACYDFEGRQQWTFNLQKLYGKFSIQHGMHVTPVLHEDRLYMALITNGGHWVLAFDKATGKEVWKQKRPSDAVGESREAYTTPVLWKNGPEMNLVVLGADYTTGHSLKDGSELWRLGDLNPKSNYSSALRIIASPVVGPNELVVPTARGGLVVALKPGAAGEIKAGSEHEAWRITKGAPDVPSPLVHDGLVYLQRENGVLLVLDVKTGKELYNMRLGDGRYRASPIYADGKIYTVGRDNGTTSVIKAGPTKIEPLGTNRLDDVFTASPVISQGRLYLRGFHSLYAISEGGK
jgi:outer membrane protein assembly factor BamB